MNNQKRKVSWVPRLLLAAMGLLLLPVPGSASFLVGGTYTITGTNFVTDFSQTLTLNDAVQTIDNGQLTVQANEYTDPTDPNSQWVDFNFQSVSGGTLASNPNALWEIQINGIPLAAPGTFTGFEAYWTVNGQAAQNIAPIGGLPGPIANPINPSLGDVYGSVFAGGAPETSIDVFLFVNPYNAVLEEGNMDPTAVNGFHIGARETATTVTPEPESATLIAIGLLALGFTLKRGRTPKAS